MEISIAECHDSCVKSFEQLIKALQAPERDFGDLLTLASIEEEYGRFKVWRGNVGARHDPSRRISLDYRLRDSKFYHDKIVRNLIELSEALHGAAQLVRAERLPVDESYSPTESSIASTVGDDDESVAPDDDGEDYNESFGRLLQRRDSQISLDNFGTLSSLLSEAAEANVEHSVAYADTSVMQTVSNYGSVLEPEVAQLRSAIADILSHLYKLSMLIRRPVPQDRLTRSSKINVKHFEHFDDTYVRDCFPSAQPWLLKRLAKAITRRRQHLVYNRKHHEKLSRPRATPRTTSLQGAIPRPGTYTAPVTVIQGDRPMTLAASLAKLTMAPLSTRFASTRATEFVPPKDYADEITDERDWEAVTDTSYASTLGGGKDIICIPPRPKDENGHEMTEFECPYCFRIQEIRSSRAWRKHVLTDITPYICTFEHCDKAATMFESRSEWYSHELQFHRKIWFCGEPDHETYKNRSQFEAHLRQIHGDEFSETQLATFVKSSERVRQADTAICPLCTEDHYTVVDEAEEPIVRREPVQVPTRVFKRHLGRHLERLALFALSSTEDEAEEEGSLPSDNLNSGVSQLSWIGSDLSSSSAEDSTPDQPTDNLVKLAGLGRRNQSVITSRTVSTVDEVPPELMPQDESGTINLKLPCREVSPYTKNPNFVGRQETFEKIRITLSPDNEDKLNGHRRTFALCGSGGVGKSQTALNYVFEEMEKFQVVLWAHASSRVQLIESFSSFAVQLGLVEGGKGKEKDPTLDADLVKSWFNETDVPWLLVVDSADTHEAVEDYVPTGRLGSVLITSRDVTLVSQYGGMILGKLDEENAVQLLLESIKRQGWTDRGDPRSKAAAISIVQRLGCFPLAIAEAAHYISSNSDRPLSDFISDYEKNDLAHLISQPQAYGSINETGSFKLSVLWNMSYRSLTADEQQLLNIMSFFDPTGIPLDLVSTAAVRAKEQMAGLGFLKDSARFQRCKDALTKASLVMQNENLGQVWMHDLYRESAQARMSPTERQQAWDRAVTLLGAMWPYADRSKRRRTDLWPEQAKYLPHVQSLAFWWATYNTTVDRLQADDRFAELLIQAASFCLMRGFFEPVDSLVEVVEVYCSQQSSDCELLLFESYWVKGGTKLQLNIFDEGFESFNQAYDLLQRAVQKSIIAADDDRIAIACGLLGNGYLASNKYDEAEEWYLKAFNMWDNMDPEVFKDKQLFISNIAVCLTSQGKYDEAQEILLHSLRTNDKIKGFKLADTLYSLGNVRIGQKDFERAFDNFKEAYGLFQNELGERHRLTANCCYRLAWLMHRQRKYNSSISMFQQALEAYEENPYYRNECARTKYMLGTVYLKADQEEAGNSRINEAKEMVKVFWPIVVGLDEWTEHDFDMLVMPWSR